MLLTCPSCQQDFEADVAAGSFPSCPHCHQAVTVDEPLTDDEATRPQDDELSALRIRATAAERRALVRQRSHLLIGAVLCLAAAVQLCVRFAELLLLAGAWQSPLLMDTLLFALLYALGVILAVHLGKRWLTRSRELKEQYSHSSLSEPQTPPDYESLSDGSQHLRALDEMTRQDGPGKPSSE
jgi:uncharacterized membrane protein YqaE (UPF0057 family)